MTIQLDRNGRVRIGNVYYPASLSDFDCYPLAMAYRIPLGESGEELSIAIGTGSYSSNRSYPDMMREFDPYGEMETVEVGYNFDGGDFDVRGYITDEELLRIIAEIMAQLTNRRELGTGE